MASRYVQRELALVLLASYLAIAASIPAYKVSNSDSTGLTSGEVVAENQGELVPQDELQPEKLASRAKRHTFDEGTPSDSNGFVNQESALHTTRVRRASPAVVESQSSSPGTGLTSKLHSVFNRAVKNEADADDGKKENVKRGAENDDKEVKEKKENGKTETVHDIINYIKEQGKKITEKIKPGEKQQFGCKGCHNDDDDDDEGSGDDDDDDDDDKDHKRHDDDGKEGKDKQKKGKKDGKHHDKKEKDDDDDRKGKDKKDDKKK